MIYKGSLLGGEREREVGSRRACMHGLGYGDVCTRWLGTTHTHTDVHVTHVIAVVLCLVIGELTRGIASFVRISGRTYRRAVNCSWKAQKIFMTILPDDFFPRCVEEEFYSTERSIVRRKGWPCLHSLVINRFHWGNYYGWNFGVMVKQSVIVAWWSNRSS